jgi:hypothetical protein
LGRDVTKNAVFASILGETAEIASCAKPAKWLRSGRLKSYTEEG